MTFMSKQVGAYFTNNTLHRHVQFWPFFLEAVQQKPWTIKTDFGVPLDKAGM